MAYTAHGHHIINTPVELPQPTVRARCGGPGICKECSNEVFIAQSTLVKLPSNVEAYASSVPVTTQTVTEPTKDTNMSITTQRYARKRFEVDAVQITDDNMAEIADWCLGEIAEERGNKYIRVKVARVLNERQTKGYVGDWVLHAGGGFKVYTTKAFLQSFDITGDAPQELLTTTEKLKTIATTVHEKPKPTAPVVPDEPATQLESKSHSELFTEPVPTV